MNEAFIYLWYDALNKMYYLGKHKGSPDDTYTHSSSIWESFTKDNIPEGVTRRILAYGTHKEMCILEHELLVNRKKRCWNRYYNNSLGDPRYVDQSGENNPQWKGGVSLDKKVYEKKYRRRSPEYHAHMREHRQTPEYKVNKRAYDKEYDKERDQTPERKAWRREYDKKLNQTPERKESEKKRNNTPERKAYKKEWNAKKKAESQGEGTLEPFLG